MRHDFVAPLPMGATAFEYEFSEPIGRGGFGTTYRCIDHHLNKSFAVKEYTPHHLVTRNQKGHLLPRTAKCNVMFREGLREFLIEARRLAKFTHPNIVSVSRFFEANNTGYFVMELHEQGSLRNLMFAKNGSLTEIEIRSLITPICDGLSELHSIGFIHRDIKPDNIILGRRGAPIIIDLGAAADFRGMTQEMLQLISTPGYAPPEQIIPGAPQGVWIDIYAVGATLYDLISGFPPPRAEERMLGRRFASAAAIGAGRFSTQLLDLIDTCIELNFELRPKNTADLLAQLALPVDRLCRRVVNGISKRMLVQFMNFAEPNPGLRLDEFVTFIIAFPIVDFGWRFSKALPTKDMLELIVSQVSVQLADECRQDLVERGFHGTANHDIRGLLRERVNEYAAAYLLDRKEQNWDYGLVLRQAARNCLAEAYKSDESGFVELLYEVVDRARMRVKRGLQKELCPVSYELSGAGWQSVRND